MAINEGTGMATEAPLTALTVSRRTTLQMALAAAVAGKIMGTPGVALAQDAPAGTWNQDGNAGHTGELPGPGLDFNRALGELWRIPEEEFGSDPIWGRARVAGYLNDVIYAMNGDGLWARRLSDGAFLWAQSPAKIAASSASMATPPAGAEPVSFSGPIAIDNDLLLMHATTRELWALDAATGELRWTIGGEGDLVFSSQATVVDHVAYVRLYDGVAALELSDPPVIRWQTQDSSRVLGVEDGYVYVEIDDEIRALNIADGSEYWRVSLGDVGNIDNVHGIAEGTVFLNSYDSELSGEYLVAINQDGQTAWQISADGFNSGYGWIVNDTITRMTPTQSVYDYCRFQSIYAGNGNPSWDLEVNASRWPYVVSGQPVVCAGKAYALIWDSDRQENLLVAVDPVNAEVFGVWGSHAVPIFMSDGIMLARDDDTGEILAIGPVPAVLQSGGRATVTQDATLRGAPSDTAIERGQVTAGTLVDVTGDSETSNGTEWAPVADPESGQSGWLPVSVLAGQDGSIRFEAINLNAFGQFTSYPKFTSGTKAEITEQVDLRGAPSASSAQKATLDAGTLVTVTSPPTTADDGDWCPISVDETGVSGWVPVSVLKLAPLY
jgi:outer membrane protein assembly factor BamB